LRDPAAALSSFDAYLAHGDGSLLQEALLGRIRSLRALGRVDEERQAIEQFLERFPSSPQADGLRGRVPEDPER
jgi:hypothetical protein